MALPSYNEWDNPEPNSVPPLSDLSKAAFGIYSNAGKRYSQTPTSVEQATSAPLSFLRGSLSSGLGLVGDIANLSVPGAGLPLSTDELHTTFGSTPQLPGTSYFQQNLPLKQSGPVNELAETLGTFAPAPVYSTTAKLASTAAKAAPALGRELAGTAVDRMMAGQSMVPGMPASMVNPPMTSIVKQGGGNWIDQGAYGVDTRVDTVKRFIPFGEDPIKMEHNMRTIGGAGDAEVQDAHNAIKINEWIDKKLKPYVRNQMGTPNDPIRAQADAANILHMPYEERLARAEGPEKIIREQQGFPRHGVATSDLGKQWEFLTDNAIRSESLSNVSNPNFYNNPKSLEKLNPSTPVNYIKDQERFDKLGFDHMIDVLGEKMNAGEITHKDLERMSVADAVKRTDDYNQKMREAMAKAEREDLKHANIVHKTDEGLVVKLDKPGQFAKESENMGHSVRGYEPPKDHPDYLKETGNSGRASYGHGGWEAIKSGKADVYSVRDFDNKPYATVETSKDYHHIGYGTKGKQIFPDDFSYGGVDKRLPQEQHQAVYNRAKQIFDGLENKSQTSLMDSFQQAADEVLGESPKNITQIKGPVNGNIDYKPAQTLKDFLNSRKWGQVDEIENAHLIDLENPQSVDHSLYDVLGDYKLPHERQEAFRDATMANPDVPRFMNREEFKNFVNPPKPVVPEKPKERYGKGWWYNSDNKQLHEISHGDLGPHGDHDGWISVGDNAEKLGVDPKVASAWQDANYGFMLPKEKVQAGLKTGEIKPNDPIDSNGEMYYNQSFGDRLKVADQHYLEKHGVPIENYEMTPPPQELENLVRIRQWPSGHVSFNLTGNASDDIVKGISSTIDKMPSLWKAPKISVYTEADEPFNFTPENFSKLKTMRDLKRYHDPSLGKTQNAEGFRKGGRVKRNLKKAPSMEMSLLDAIKKHYPEGLSDAVKKINKSTAPKKKTLKIDDMRYALMKGK
jgi:hypothetical protein